MQRLALFLACVGLVTLISGCASLPIRHTLSMETCADKIAASIARDLRKVQGERVIRVATPVDAVTYAQSDFGLAFQELLTGTLAGRLPHVVDAHYRKGPGVTGKTGTSPLSRSEPVSTAPAGIVLVSTYLASGGEVVVTTRALDANTREVIASTYAVLSRSEQVDDLLERPKGVIVYEK